MKDREVQGERDNIQLSLVGDRTLLTILFDDRTTVGMVRLYANETAKKLAAIYHKVAGREAGEGDPSLDAGYGTDVKKKLENQRIRQSSSCGICSTVSDTSVTERSACRIGSLRRPTLQSCCARGGVANRADAHA